MVVPSVSAVSRFPLCRFTVLASRLFAFCVLLSVLPFQLSHRFENHVFRFEGHARRPTANIATFRSPLCASEANLSAQLSDLTASEI